MLILFCAMPSFATVLTPKFPDEGVTGPDNNTFIDPRVDYSKFMGRVTDRDSDSGRILKVKVEINNTKFFKAGDVIYFRVNKHDTELPCRASVRSVEDYYFTIYVTDFDQCWEEGKYFPRGLMLNFKSNVLAQRVFEASKYRETLIDRKEGFLKQLSNINHFLWTFDQQRMQTAASYDEKINKLKREKQMAIDNLLQSKQENLLLQVELMKKLDNIDESMKHYRVERGEYLMDRWNMDHDSGIGFPQRPPKLKEP
jgi:hypothetical protein